MSEAAASPFDRAPFRCRLDWGAGGAAAAWARGDVVLVVDTLTFSTTVAAAVAALLARTGLCATVVAAGERWPAARPEGALRMAVEDYLGAGAVLAGVALPKSPEARVCEAAFLAASSDVAAIVWEGRELRETGSGEDVRFAANLDRLATVPEFDGLCITAAALGTQ